VRDGNWLENWADLIRPNTDKEIVKKLQYRLERSYQVDRNGREIMHGDRVSGLFYNGRPITGICEFSRKHSAWGIRWNRGGVAEFTPFCCTCNVEWEVEDDG
jgi:hypothetical protein